MYTIQQTNEHFDTTRLQGAFSQELNDEQLTQVCGALLDISPSVSTGDILSNNNALNGNSALNGNGVSVLGSGTGGNNNGGNG